MMHHVLLFSFTLKSLFQLKSQMYIYIVLVIIVIDLTYVYQVCYTSFSLIFRLLPLVANQGKYIEKKKRKIEWLGLA